MIERWCKYRNIVFPSTERKDSHAPQKAQKKKKKKDAIRFGEKP